jgi:protein gp37
MAGPENWNIWHGCRRYSEGCDNCYMFYLDDMRGVSDKSKEIALTKDTDGPLKKDRYGRFRIPSGTVVSVNMTSDTFLEEADEWRPDMWRIIRKRPDLIFYLLTKRVPRIPECLPGDWGKGYDNVILNISCENQRAFNERWPIFERIPAKHKGLNLAPLIGEMDITPALSSGQIEQVNMGGEGFGGRRPCRYEWIERIGRDCERYKVNFTVNTVGTVFIKNGFCYESKTVREQAVWADKIGLSRFFGRPHYDLYSPYDGHPLSEDELFKPVFNKYRCMQCPNRNICNGCSNCGKCDRVELVDIEGNPVGNGRKTVNASLDRFL